MKEDKRRYFVQHGDNPEKEVTKQQYMDAEWSAGFRGKFPGEPATASFSTGGPRSPYIKGRIEYEPTKG